MRISDWSSDVCSSDLFQPHFDRSARFHIVPRKIGIRATRCTPKPFAASKASFVRILISVVVAVTGFLDVEFRQQHADDIGTALREALERVACVAGLRSDEHTSELPSLMRISYV